MVEISDESFQEVASEIRDIINWVAVFNEEYSLPEEVTKKLQARLHVVAEKLGVESVD